MQGQSAQITTLVHRTVDCSGLHSFAGENHCPYCDSLSQAVCNN